MPVSTDTVVSATRALIETFKTPSMRRNCINALREELNRMERELTRPRAKPKSRRDVSTFTQMRRSTMATVKLDLPLAVKAALVEGEYTNLGRIVRSSNAELLKLENFGAESLTLVLAMLTRLEQAARQAP